LILLSTGKQKEELPLWWESRTFRVCPRQLEQDKVEAKEKAKVINTLNFSLLTPNLFIRWYRF
jgi:hypothetical protein